MAAQVSDGPRVRVAALIMHNGKAVTVRHRAGDLTYHLLPGGGVGYRETLEEALLREVLEETGLKVRIGKPLLLSDTIDPGGSRHLVNIVFAAEVVGGHITSHPQDKRVEAVDLFEPEELAELDLRPPISKNLARLIADGDEAQAAYLGPLFTAGKGNRAD